MQFGLYLNSDLPGYLIDCQSDLLSDLNTRLVVPLMPPEYAPKPAGRLNPAIDVGGEPHLMVTQFAGAVMLRELGRSVGSVDRYRDTIVAALDLLITGV